MAHRLVLLLLVASCGPPASMYDMASRPNVSAREVLAELDDPDPNRPRNHRRVIINSGLEPSPATEALVALLERGAACDPQILESLLTRGAKIDHVYLRRSKARLPVEPGKLPRRVGVVSLALQRCPDIDAALTLLDARPAAGLSRGFRDLAYQLVQFADAPTGNVPAAYRKAAVAAWLSTDQSGNVDGLVATRVVREATQAYLGACARSRARMARCRGPLGVRLFKTLLAVLETTASTYDKGATARSGQGDHDSFVPVLLRWSMLVDSPQLAEVVLQRYDDIQPIPRRSSRGPDSFFGLRSAEVAELKRLGARSPKRAAQWRRLRDRLTAESATTGDDTKLRLGDELLAAHDQLQEEVRELRRRERKRQAETRRKSREFMSRARQRSLNRERRTREAYERCKAAGWDVSTCANDPYYDDKHQAWMADSWKRYRGKDRKKDQQRRDRAPDTDDPKRASSDSSGDESGADPKDAKTKETQDDDSGDSNTKVARCERACPTVTGTCGAPVSASPATLTLPSKPKKKIRRTYKAGSVGARNRTWFSSEGAARELLDLMIENEAARVCRRSKGRLDSTRLGYTSCKTSPDGKKYKCSADQVMVTCSRMEDNPKYERWKNERDAAKRQQEQAEKKASRYQSCKRRALQTISSCRSRCRR